MERRSLSSRGKLQRRRFLLAGRYLDPVSHGRFVRLHDIYIALRQPVAGDGNYKDVERALGTVKLGAAGVNFGCPFLYTWNIVILQQPAGLQIYASRKFTNQQKCKITSFII